MPLQLESLVFEVNTDKLKAAKDAIDALAGSMNNLNNSQEKEVKSANDSVNAKAKTAKTIQDNTKAIDENTKATERKAKADENLANTSGSVDKLIGNLTTKFYEMARGMTSGETTIINLAKNLNATADQMATVRNLLQEIGSLNKNPFDASIGAIRSMTKAVEDLQHRADLAAQGVVLNTKQLQEYSRISTEIAAQLKSAGVDISQGVGLDQFNKMVADTKSQYMGLFGTYQTLAGAEKELARSQRDRENAVRNLATAEEKAASMVATYTGAVQTGDSITERAAMSIANYDRWLKQAGYSGQEAATKLALFSKQQTIIAAQEQKQREAYLQRAIIPQFSDIFVGLTTGMNPLTVALQQLPQIQDLFTLTGVKAQDTVKVIGNAASEMVNRLSATAVAVTQAIGLGFQNLGSQMIFLDRQMQALDTGRAFVSKFTRESSIATKAFDAFAVVIRSTAALAGGVLVGSLASASLALVQTVKANNAATKSLYEYGAATGLTRDDLISLANASASFGTSSNELKSFFGELIKGGVRSKEALQSAAEGATYFRAVTGESLEDIGKRFTDLGKDPVKALTELAKNTGLVTVATIEGIEYLIKQGDTLGANALAAEIYSQALQQLAKDQYNALTPLEQLWINVKIAGGEAWQSVLDFANSPVVVNGLKGIALAGLAIVSVLREIGQSGISAFKALSNPLSAGAVWEDWKAQISIIRTDSAKMRDEIIFGNQGVDASNRQTNANASAGLSENKKLREELAKAAEAGLTKEQKLLQDTNKIHELYRKNIIAAGNDKEKQVAVVRDYELALAGLNKTNESSTKSSKASSDSLKEYNSTLKQFSDMQIEATGSAQELTKAQVLMQKVVESDWWKTIDPSLKEAILKEYELANATQEATKEFEAQAKALEKLQKVFDDLDKVNLKYTQEIEATSAEIEFQYSILGKTESQVKDITKAYETQKNIAKINAEYEKDKLELIKKQAEAIKGMQSDPIGELIAQKEFSNGIEELGIKRNEKVEQEHRKEQLKTVQEYDKHWKEIQSGLADALYTSLTEGGKKGAVKVKDLIKAQLKKLAMEPINILVNLVMDTSKAALSGLLSLVTGGKTGNSWVDSGLDMLKTGKSLYDIYNAPGTVGTALGVANQASIYSGLTYGTGFGSQQSAMLAAQEAGMGGAGTWNSIANSFGEVAGNITGKIAGKEIGKAATTEAAKQSATATTSMWSNMLNVAGAGLSAYGVGQAVGQKYGTVAGTAAGTLAGAGTYAVGSAVAGGAFAGGAAAGMAGVYSSLAAIPVWGWIAAGVVALFGAMGGSKPKSYGDIFSGKVTNGEMQDVTGYSPYDRSMGAGGALQDIASAFASTYNGVLAEFGQDANYTIDMAYRRRRKSGKFAGGLSIDGVSVESDESKGYTLEKMFEGVMSTGLTNAFAKSALPDQIKKLFEGFERFDMTGVTTAIAAIVNMNQFLKTEGTTLEDFIGSMDFEAYRLEGEKNVDIVSRMLTSILQMNETFDKLGLALFDLSSAGFDATETLKAAFGGLEGLNNKLASYYNNYYTAEEKRANVIKDITGVLLQAGAQITEAQLGSATRAEFRAVFESIVEIAGAASPLAIAMLQVEDAFAGVTEETKSLGDSAKETAEAAKKLNDEINSQRLSLERELMQLLGDTNGLRNLEIESIHESNRALKERIWSIEDSRKNAQDAFSALQRAVAAEKKILSDKYNADVDAINNSLKAQQEANKLQEQSANDMLNNIKKIFDALSNALDKNIVKDFQMDFARQQAARLLVRNAASSNNIFATGLEDALGVIDSNETKYYSTFEDYARDQLLTGNDIAKLKASAESQMSTAELTLLAIKNGNESADSNAKAQLEALKKQYDSDIAALDQTLVMAQAQLDAMNGVNASVLSVKDALTGFQAAIQGAMQAQTAAMSTMSARSTSPASTTTSSGNVGNVGGAPDSYWNSLNKVVGLSSYNDNGVARQVPFELPTGLSTDIYDQFDPSGETSRNLLQAGLATQGSGSTFASGNHFDMQTPITDWMKQQNIPSYDIGTNKVPNDMLANIHKNEAIIPAKFNPWVGGTLPVDNTDLAEAVAILTEEVQMLRYEARATAINTSKMTKQLDRSSDEQDSIKVTIVSDLTV